MKGWLSSPLVLMESPRLRTSAKRGTPDGLTPLTLAIMMLPFRNDEFALPRTKKRVLPSAEKHGCDSQAAELTGSPMLTPLVHPRDVRCEK